MRILFNKRRALFFCVMLSAILLNAQNQKKKGLDVTEFYKISLDKQLNPVPESAQKKVIVLFTYRFHPMPECSMRVVDIGKYSFLEIRTLEESLWDKLLTDLRNNEKKLVLPKAMIYSFRISKTFRNNMLSKFQKVLCTEEPKMKPDLYDGICYEYRVNMNGKWKSKDIVWSLKKNSLEGQVSSTNIQIIEDIRTKSFSESKYLIFNRK